MFAVMALFAAPGFADVTNTGTASANATGIGTGIGNSNDAVSNSGASSSVYSPVSNRVGVSTSMNPDIDVNPVFGDNTLSTSTAVDNTDISDNDVFIDNSDNSYHEAADLKDARGFGVPGDMVFPGTPGYFGEACPGHAFMPIAKIIMFTQAWDVDSAKNMLKGRDGAKDVQVRKLYGSEGVLETDKIHVSINKPNAENIKPLAFATVAAKSGSSISADVFAKMLVRASEVGANHVMFLAEGVNRKVAAWGFGIGFNHTNADLKGGGNGSSGMSTGGTGWSYGEAGYVDKPWLQAVFLHVPSVDAE